MSCDMWFGTQDYAQYIPTPLSGADVSPGAWGESGVLLNGSGYALNSFNSHKQYRFSWRKSSAPATAQLMKSFFDGSFGRGKLYFHDPLTYRTNVLPARWADPSITCNFEGPDLVPGRNPVSVRATGGRDLRLPVTSAQFAIPVSGTYRSNTLFIPIPDGMQLNVGAFYESTGANAGVYVSPVTEGGTLGAADTRLTPMDNTTTDLFPEVFTKQPGDIGVAMWFGKPNGGAAETLTVNAVHARLSPVGEAPGGELMWIGGQGHSGVRFTGAPSYINHNGRDGGQVEFAATFTESVL